LNESRDRVAHIEEYKEDLQNKVLQLKQILEQQKQISITKIKYIEDKYQNVKEINVGLEVNNYFFGSCFRKASATLNTTIYFILEKFDTCQVQSLTGYSRRNICCRFKPN